MLPVGVKIFAIATSMLIFLISLAASNYHRISLIRDELVDIAQYFAPLAAAIDRVDVHVLEQQIHLERLFRLSEIKPVDEQDVEREFASFEALGTRVDDEIVEAVSISDEAARQARITEDVIELARLGPRIALLERQHQDFHDHAMQIIDRLRNGNTKEARLLEERLREEEDHFDDQLEEIVAELGGYMESATRRAEAHQQGALWLNWVLGSSATVFGFGLGAFLTAGLVRPVRLLLSGTEAVAAGNLNVRVGVASGDEIGTLADSFNTMVEGIRQKERIKGVFGQYVDPRIVEELIDRDGATLDGGQKQVMTVFFSDMAGFSTISETLTPSGLVNLMNEYLTLTCEPLLRHKGVIANFIGDAVVAFWGPPFSSPDEHARLACFSALAQSGQLEALRRALPDILGFRKGLPKIRTRVGLATGELIAGNIGSEQSKTYTVTGQPVLVAEQLEGANKVLGTMVLLTEATRRLAGDVVETREVDLLPVAGQSDPVGIYELLGRTGEVTSAVLELRGLFEQGLGAYRTRDWDRAQASFQACQRLDGTDGPTRVYLQRIERFRATPPPPNWNGVWV